MVDQKAEGTGKPLAPPYTAYLTIRNLVGTFKEHGLPGQIDRSVLSNMSGAVQSQVLTALKFLGLIGHSDGAPRAPLKRLIEAHGSEEWPAALADVLRAAYAPLFELDLSSASPNQFNDKFRTAYPSADGDTLRKCMTFFLNATRDAAIPVSNYIMKNKKPRAAVVKKRANAKAPDKSKKAEFQTNGSEEFDEVDDPIVEAKTPYQVLMDEIYDPKGMDAGSEEEKAVFVLARYLKIKEARG